MRARVLTLLISLAVLTTSQELRAQNPPATARQLAWVDRAGQTLGTIGPRMNAILDPSISPDGARAAVRGRLVQGETEHLYILEGTTAKRLTSNEGSERHMIWSPDGSRIAYSIQNAGTGTFSNLYVRAADGSGADQPLVVSDGMHKWYPSWTPDASTLVYHIAQGETRDLWSVNAATGQTSVLVEDQGIQALPRLSRDGRFVAYQSDQDGSMEIWVTTFPRSAARWKVSTNGGTWAKWSNDELFYWQGNQLMAVRYTRGSDGSFNGSTPRALFTGAQAGMGAENRMTSYNPEYDVSADGTRFVVTQRVGP